MAARFGEVQQGGFVEKGKLCGNSRYGFAMLTVAECLAC